MARFLLPSVKGAHLFPHHTESDPYNFSQPTAEITVRPFGLRNLSKTRWAYSSPNGPRDGSTSWWITASC